MVDISYCLATSEIVVRATQRTVVDRLSEGPPIVETSDVSVEHRFSAAGDRQRLRIGERGSTDVGATLTEDGRLRSLDYEAAGSGSAILTTATKLIAFVGTVALGALTSPVRSRLMAFSLVDVRAPDPYERWKGEHQHQAELLERNQAALEKLAMALVQLRLDMASEEDRARLAALQARERCLVLAREDVRKEVQQLQAVFAAWRAGHLTTTSAEIETAVRVASLDLDDGNQPSADVNDRLYQEFGVVLRVDDPHRRRQQDAAAPTGWSVENATDGWPSVRWREPRVVTLAVWKRSGSGLALVSRTPVQIVDRYSPLHVIPLRSTHFGAHGGSLLFSDAGVPTQIKLNDESTAGAVLSALGGMPDAATGGYEQAKKVLGAVQSVRDSDLERQKVNAENQLALERARLESLGVAATAEDFATLKRAEQAAELRAATRSLSPEQASLDDLKRELEVATTQNKLEATQQSTQIARELADLRLQIARMEAETKLKHAGTPGG